MPIVTITTTMRPKMVANILTNIQQQVRKPDIAAVFYHKWNNDSPEDWLLPTLRKEGVDCYAVKCDDSWLLPKLLRFAQDDVANKLSSGLMCIFDDDDWYGPAYLAEVEEAFRLAPDAAIIGKAAYPVRWPYAPNRLIPATPSYPNLPAATNYVAGPTICINIDFYRKNQNFRIDTNAPWADDSIRMAAFECQGKIYTTSNENFYLQRYGPEHHHGWMMPDP